MGPPDCTSFFPEVIYLRRRVKWQEHNSSSRIHTNSVWTTHITVTGCCHVSALVPCQSITALATAVTKLSLRTSTEIVPVFIKDISSYLYRPKVDLLFIDSVLAINIYMHISKHWLEGKKKTKNLQTENISQCLHNYHKT